MEEGSSKTLSGTATNQISLSGLPIQDPGRSSSLSQISSVARNGVTTAQSQMSMKSAASSQSTASSNTTRPTAQTTSEMIWKHGAAKEVLLAIASATSASFNPPPELKERVEKAKKDHKIFMTNVRYPAVREALERRGWVQKHANAGTIPETLMSPIGEERQYQAKRDKAIRTWIDEALANHPADLIWRFGYDKFDWKETLPHQLVNYHASCYMDPKLQLVERLHELQWYSEQDVAYTYAPRCYLLSVPEERHAFVGDYCLSACVGLLQWFVGSFEQFGELGVTSKRPGLTPACFHFAIGQLRHYISIRTHKDIDWAVTGPLTLNDSWKIFLNQWYDIIYGNKRLHFAGANRAVTLKELYETCKLALQAIASYWPQMYIDGTFNVWICKPGRGIQGAGILIMNDLDKILGLLPDPKKPDNKNWIVQKYIERPLLVYNTKCDFRQWFMVTDWRPLTVWFYKEAYFRFSSQPFRINRMGNSVHVLNTQVQGKFEVSDSRDPRLPEDSMWDTSEFFHYLKKKGKAELWRTKTYPEVKRSLLSILMACQDHVGQEYRKNCFQVYGADFMISGDMTPWLLEINGVPFFGTTRTVTKRLVPQFLEDVIKDRRNNPHANIGSFELMHKGKYSPTDYMPAETPMTIISGKKVFPDRLPAKAESSVTIEVEPARTTSSIRTLSGTDQIFQDLRKRMTLKEVSAHSFTTLDSESKKADPNSEWEDTLVSLADRFRALESRLLSKVIIQDKEKQTSQSELHSKSHEDIRQHTPITPASKLQSGIATPARSSSILIPRTLMKNTSKVKSHSEMPLKKPVHSNLSVHVGRVKSEVSERMRSRTSKRTSPTASTSNAMKILTTALSASSHSQRSSVSPPKLLLIKAQKDVSHNKDFPPKLHVKGSTPSKEANSTKIKRHLNEPEKVLPVHSKQPSRQTKPKPKPSMVDALSRLKAMKHSKSHVK